MAKSRNIRGRVIAVVGAQYGSEGKGVVANYLAPYFQIAVRTGGPNAGHSIVHAGKLYKMQTIPCAWTNPSCRLIIGAGGLINLSILERELKWIEAVPGYESIRKRVLIDHNTGILEERHHQEEGGVEGEGHKRIGSTGEGVGAARRDRINRNPAIFRKAIDCEELESMGVVVTDTVEYLNWGMWEARCNVMLEGTQGSALSLVHGEWPYVTSHDTNAAQLAADAGIPPQYVQTILVARTYPIRVAGNSGELNGELSWEEMSKRTGKIVEERTTVTNKVRRIGEWDEDLFAKAIKLNDPFCLALTFMDYLDPDVQCTWYSSHTGELVPEVPGVAGNFIRKIEKLYNIPVYLAGIGWSTTAGWQNIDFNRAHWPSFFRMD